MRVFSFRESGVVALDALRQGLGRMPIRFVIPLLAMLLVSVGGYVSLALIAEQKLRYALFQRDLLALVTRWDGAVRATALLPISGYKPQIAYQDGMDRLADVRREVRRMEQEVGQLGWLDPDIQLDLKMLFHGFHSGLDELALPYADLGEFIAYHVARGSTEILRVTMSDLVRRTWRVADDGVDHDRLFYMVRLYGNVARLDANITVFIDSKAADIRSRVDAVVADRFQWYAWGQAALGATLVLLVALLMRRLSDLYQASIVDKDAMARLSFRDALTDLPNRRALADLVPHWVDRAQRMGQGFCLMLLDVDNFKGVNDTLGHKAGDLLLKTLAERMTGVLRKPAVAARLGGDEFVLILPETDQVCDAQSVARRLLAQMAEPMDYEGQSLTFSISIGITQCPMGGSSLETLLHSADMALYEAKRAGKNAFALYSPPSESN